MGSRCSAAGCDLPGLDCDVVVEAPQEDGEEQLAGRWVSAQGNVHIVGLDAVHWHSNDISRLRKRWCYSGKRRTKEYATELDGVVFTARINEDGQLEWSDGDIWVRDSRVPETGAYAAMSSALGQVGESFHDALPGTLVDALAAAPGAVASAAYFVASPVVKLASSDDTTEEPHKAAELELLPATSQPAAAAASEGPRPPLKPLWEAALARRRGGAGNATPTASPFGAALGRVGWSLDISTSRNPYETPAARVARNGSPLRSSAMSKRSLATVAGEQPSVAPAA